jgi:penicillin-binding protein 1A
MNRSSTSKLSWLGSLWATRAKDSPANPAEASTPAVPPSPTRRTRRRTTPPRRPLLAHKRYWFCAGLGIVVGVAGSGYFTVERALEAMRRDLPDVEDVLTYARDGTLTITTGDGTILQTIGPATREKVRLEEVPQVVIDAFIASEDKNFYDHDGVDYWAIVRAMRANIRAGEVVEGASTITQQLARIVFLDQDRTYDRKLREALLAQKMERQLAQDSSSDAQDPSSDAQDPSSDAQDPSSDAQDPSSDAQDPSSDAQDPSSDAQDLIPEQKRTILERYLNLVYLGSGAYGVADAAWIYFSKPVSELTLSEAAMIAGLPPAPTHFSPLVNPDIALQRRDIVLSRMLEAELISPEEWDAAIAEELALNPSPPKYFDSEIPYFTTFVQQQLPQLITPEQLEMGGLTVETTLDLEWQRIAEETIENAIANYGTYEAFQQAALVSLDPRTGAIRAMVGGNDFSESQFNRVTQAQRQPGSTFKTFVYTAAIASGMSPNKTYEDAPFKVDGYEPQNYGRRFRGTISIRDALIASVNVVAVKALIDVGFDPVVTLATKMGIQSDLMPTYSMALGASEVTLLELTSAYGTLAAQGMHATPHGIVRIRDRNGDIIYEMDTPPERAVDENTAAIVTWVLQGVVESGTGAAARLPGRAVAGKTGTSENYRDLWFIGYIPQLVTGVWLGNDDSTRTWGSSGTAALTWYDFMSRIVGELEVESFPALPPLDGRQPTIQAQPVRVQPQTPTGNPTPTPSSGSAPADDWTPSAAPAEDYSEPSPTSPAPPPVSEAPPPVSTPPEVPIAPIEPSLDEALPPLLPEPAGVPVEPGMPE